MYNLVDILYSITLIDILALLELGEGRAFDYFKIFSFHRYYHRPS